ncbi:MAG: Gfo/Idh/MocA family oxidoreductase [Spirochaetes bacterium]|nr:Gfo/Idh/MocA family oxidoreductase [Spirochaetota bacterium]
MKTINVGFIGLGRIADLHYLGYKNNKQATLYAACDINQQLVEQRARQWHITATYTNYNDMLSDPHVDAVEILTPHALHEPVVIAAAHAGKHIALQKPMTVDLASADRILAAVKQSGKIFKVTDNYAFYPPIRLAKKIIENGEIGDPITIRIKFIGGGSGGWYVPPEAWQWRLKEHTESGGVRGFDTFDHGHHLWTTAWYLCGSVERVAGWIDSIDGIIDAPSVMIWKHTRGVYGSIEFVHMPALKIPSKYYANDEWIEVSGTQGICIIHRCTGEVVKGPSVSVFTSKGWKHYNENSDWALGFVGATHNFIAAIRGEDKPMLSGDDAREILRFSLAIQKSAKMRREVYTQELDCRFPSVYYYLKHRKEVNASKPQKTRFLERIGINTDLSQYAPEAKKLTDEFLQRYNPDAVKQWTVTIALDIENDGNTKGFCYGILINNSLMTVKEGVLPEKWDLKITVPAGVWAAILLKKKRIEMAYLKGQIKIEGKAEEALKLRAAFGI